MLTIQNLSVSYGQERVLWNINTSLSQGELIGIVGPNGAGKSTLLKAIMEIIPRESGEVQFWGDKLNQVRKRIAYIPQRKSVDWEFPISVKEVVAMGRYTHLGLFGRFSSDDDAIVKKALETVKLSKVSNQQIGALSGGQQQRVFLARALAQEADLYLMDEPFAAIDAVTANEMMQILQRLTQEGKTILVVNHDLISVQQYFTTTILLNRRIIANGPTKEVLTPKLLEETYGTQLTILSKIDSLHKDVKTKLDYS